MRGYMWLCDSYCVRVFAREISSSRTATRTHSTATTKNERQKYIQKKSITMSQTKFQTWINAQQMANTFINPNQTEPNQTHIHINAICSYIVWTTTIKEKKQWINKRKKNVLFLPCAHTMSLLARLLVSVHITFASCAMYNKNAFLSSHSADFFSWSFLALPFSISFSFNFAITHNVCWVLEKERERERGRARERERDRERCKRHQYKLVVLHYKKTLVPIVRLYENYRKKTNNTT